MYSAKQATKKPVTIEYMKFETNNEDGDVNMYAIVAWITVNNDSCKAWHDGTSIFIETLEGVMRADCGDYIIRGVQGEFYPCKADIFEATYDF